MRRLLDVSCLMQSGMDVSGYSAMEVALASQMYEYVKEHSDDFKCSYSWLMTLWKAAYFKFCMMKYNQICYKSNEVCQYNCSGLCRDSY